MKIVLTHDVDHLFPSDHLFDTFYPGLLLRSSKQLLRNEISFSSFLRRFNFFRPLNNIKTLSNFLLEKKLPATFFFGMRKGLNLSYSYKAARPFIELLIEKGFEVGVHGMAFNDFDKMKEEKQRFEEIAGFSPKYIRNHYLRYDESTHSLMDQLEYKIDSTLHDTFEIDQIGSLCRFPISIMDVTVMKSSKEKGITPFEFSLAKLDEAGALGVSYFVINFHDAYYSDCYPIYKKWYESILEEFISRGLEFCRISDVGSE